MKYCKHAMANNPHTQSAKHVFQSQAKALFDHPNPDGVVQDKSALTFDRIASGQPAALTKGMRLHPLRSKNQRSQKQASDKRRLVPLTIQLQPLVKAELQRIGEQEYLSISRIGATAIEDWVHQKLHKQHETLLYPIIRQIIREELRAFGNRIVFFLMRIAYASEQVRILVTNILDRILKREGVPTERFHALVDQSNRLARRNIIQKTPQLKTLLAEWEGSWHEESTKQQGTSSA